jgi:hypothetical protein
MTEYRLPQHIRPSETLLIRRIPPNENTILKLFEHFKRYGRIQAIHSDGAQTALVTYATLEGAETAFRSPEAYAGNRLVQYRYPEDPSKVESRLSSVVPWPKVDQVLAQVSAEIANAEKETARLQDAMKQTHAQPLEPLSLAAMLEEFKASRDALTAAAEQLLKQREEADEDHRRDIDAKLDLLAHQLIEVEDSIAQIEDQGCS